MTQQLPPGPLRDLIREVLRRLDEDRAAEAAEAARLRAEGYRVVTHEGWNTDDDIIHVRDMDTYELMYVGRGVDWQPEDVDKLVHEDHVFNVTREIERPPLTAPGLPPSMIEYIEEWTMEHESEAVAAVGKL